MIPQRIALFCLCWLLLTWTSRSTSDVGARNRAFIGYTELTSGSCVDQLEDCEERAVDNGCLYDVYTMRTFCSATCNVERCTARSSKHKTRLKGHATASATQRYASNVAGLVHVGSGHWRDTLHPEEGLTLSSLAISTTVGDANKRTDEAVESALVHAVTHGWNVIDTDSSFNAGRAEVLTGRALSYLLSGDLSDKYMHETVPPPAPPHMPRGFYQNYQGAAMAPGAVLQPPPPPLPPSPFPPPTFVQQRLLRQDITRDMLFISTKAGYIDTKLSMRLIKAGNISAADVVRGHHCLHPRCLEASLSRSLSRLGLDTLDVLYLHDAAEVQLELLGREQFLERLLAAFQYLEQVRADGLIRSYGVATWDCFRVAPSDARHLPLQEVAKLAQLAGGKAHGLRYLQVPINAAMPEAWLQLGWQGLAGVDPKVSGGQTLVTVAHALHIGVFATSPLMREGQLVSMARGVADSVLELWGVDETAGKLLQLVRSTPGVQSVVVGQVLREWVESNVRLAEQPVLSQQQFLRAHGAVARAVAKVSKHGGATARRQQRALRRRLRAHR